jgi:hypothetical protein
MFLDVIYSLEYPWSTDVLMKIPYVDRLVTE